MALILDHTMRFIRRDAVVPGMIVRSSHGYDLLVIKVVDTAERRTDDRHVEIVGHLHANKANPTRSERYPARSTIRVLGMAEEGNFDDRGLTVDLDDRGLIIDALRDYERKAEQCERLALRGTPDDEAAEAWRGRAEDALRIRAELKDNVDYVVRGGGA